MAGGTWTLSGINLGNMQDVGTNVTVQGVEFSPMGFQIDQALTYDSEGPLGRMNLSFKRTNPGANATPENPTNADFILLMESVFDAGPQFTRRPQTVRFQPNNVTQYPPRTLRVFVRAFNYQWSADAPDLLSYSITVTRRGQ